MILPGNQSIGTWWRVSVFNKYDREPTLKASQETSHTRPREAWQTCYQLFPSEEPEPKNFSSESYVSAKPEEPSDLEISRSDGSSGLALKVGSKLCPL
jgi:hypothetical protein